MIKLEFSKRLPEIGNTLSAKDVKEHRADVHKQGGKPIYTSISRDGRGKSTTLVFIGKYVFMERPYSKNLGSKQYITIKVP